MLNKRLGVEAAGWLLFWSMRALPTTATAITTTLSRIPLQCLSALSVPFLAFTGVEDVVAFPWLTERFYNADDANSVKGIVNKKVGGRSAPN